MSQASAGLEGVHKGTVTKRGVRYTAAVARLPARMVGSEFPARPFLCPVCSVANAMLTYEDDWKQVFLCLDCRHLWHTPLAPNSPKAVESASPAPATRR